jgi:3-dehydroquinate synthetase
MTDLLRKDVSATHDRSYCVAVVPGLANGSVGDLVEAIAGRKCLLVTTPSVARLYANRIASRLLESGVELSLSVVECSEASKSLAEVERLCEQCFRAGLDRRSLLIGCGGGVCTDLVTMAAALTRRGLGYIRIPTTLIGLIDAGIGIKGAVNLPGKKSAIGCFYPPERVLLDPAFLRTLPPKLISDGLAEAIKVAVVMDVPLFSLLEQASGELLRAPSVADHERLTDLVWRPSTRLLEELEPNLYEEQTYQRLLDFGHTFSPMIEARSHFQISHGTAVAIDIALSTAGASELGLLSWPDHDRILRLLLSAGLPLWSDLLSVESCVGAMNEIEAHRGGRLNLVVPTGIGSAAFIIGKGQLPGNVLRKALDQLQGEYQEHPPALLTSALTQTSAREGA